MKDTNEIIHRSRRRFLGMMTKAGIAPALCRAVPLVGGLMATRQAHANGGIKRAIFVFTPNGAPEGLWLPNGTALNDATRAYQGVQSVCHFREVRVERSGHGLARKALGVLRWNRDWRGDTYDHQVASVLGANMPYQMYVFGAEADDSLSRTAGSGVAAQNSPLNAYQQLFSGPPPSSGGADARLARMRRVMEISRLGLNEIRTKLCTFERELMDQHEVALQQVEDRLVAASTTPQPTGCASPSWNANGYPTSGNIPFLHKVELHADVMVAAMRCGLLNVATLQLGTSQAGWSAHDTNHRGDHHNACHGAPITALAEMTNYLSRCIAYLVQKLVDTDDPAVPGTKMIDNTLVLQVTEMGNGRSHGGDGGPNMLATRMPAFRTGTVTRGGTNLEVLEAVTEGLGLRPYVGEDENSHKIWPHGGGRVAGGMLS